MISVNWQMNSYFKMNRDYREAYLEDKESKQSSYPENINFKDFFMFLRHPTFVYQDTYPLSNDSSLGLKLKRFILIIFGMVSSFYFIWCFLIGHSIWNLLVTVAPTNSFVLRWCASFTSFWELLHSHCYDVSDTVHSGIWFCVQLLCWVVRLRR